jgi:hypothetical protein
VGGWNVDDPALITGEVLIGVSVKVDRLDAGVERVEGSPTMGDGSDGVENVLSAGLETPFDIST